MKLPEWCVGYEIVAPRGLETKEFYGSVVYFSPEDKITRKGFNKKLADVFVKQVIGRYYDLQEILDAAPHANLRLFKEVPCDYGVRIGGQLEKCVERIKTDKDTRRAIIVLGRPEDEVPSCIQEIQFLVRDNKVFTFVYMRAWDSFLGLPYDMSMFRAISEFIGKGLNLGVGGITVMTASYHEYTGVSRNTGQE